VAINEVIDKSGAWAYFDMAAQGEPLIGGAGGITYLTLTGTNSKRAWVKLILRVEADKGVQKIQIIGDSLLVIEWMKGETPLENFILRPILEKILNIKDALAVVSFMHVHRKKQDNRLIVKRRIANGSCILAQVGKERRQSC